MQKRCCIGTVQPIDDVVTIPFNCSPSMISFMPFRGSYGCSSALIVLGWFDPPRMNEWKLGNAFAGGTKERTRSDVLSTPATIMPMIVLSAVRIYQQVVVRLCLALWSRHMRLTAAHFLFCLLFERAAACVWPSTRGSLVRTYLGPYVRRPRPSASSHSSLDLTSSILQHGVSSSSSTTHFRSSIVGIVSHRSGVVSVLRCDFENFARGRMVFVARIFASR